MTEETSELLSPQALLERAIAELGEHVEGVNKAFNDIARIKMWDVVVDAAIERDGVNSNRLRLAATVDRRLAGFGERSKWIYGRKRVTV